MASDDELWLDAQAGPVVRSYVLTRGRTRHTGEAFDLVSTVTTTNARIFDPAALGPEHVSVLHLVQRPTTVVDIASDVDLPLGVVRILLGDLRELGLISIKDRLPMQARIVYKYTLRVVLHCLRGL